MAEAFVVDLSPTALPHSLLFAEATLTPDSTHREAYDRARHIEELGQWPTLPPSSPTDPTDNMKWPESLKPEAAGRLLGYMLTEAYNREGADAIAREINRCGNKESKDHWRTVYDLADLARFYSMTLMKTCTSLSFYRT